MTAAKPKLVLEPEIKAILWRVYEERRKEILESQINTDNVTPLNHDPADNIEG
jgi:hypothetical protein